MLFYLENNNNGLQIRNLTVNKHLKDGIKDFNAKKICYPQSNAISTTI